MTDPARPAVSRIAAPELANDPDTQNSEQNEQGTQAQDVTDDVRRGSNFVLEESEKIKSNDPGEIIADDTPDLVDHMNEMVRSGHIDMGAFAGEDDHDDESVIDDDD